MDWTAEGLRDSGYEGFVRLATMDRTVVPKEPGVYVVLREPGSGPQFLGESEAGRFKGKDPTVSRTKLEAAWVDGAVVLYIGKASGGRSGRRGLRKRLGEYSRHGAGEPVGHWGGRYIWQLADRDELVVAWKPTPETDPEVVESALITEFTDQHGARPFANRKGGRQVDGTKSVETMPV